MRERARFGGVAERFRGGWRRHGGVPEDASIARWIEARAGRRRRPPPASSIPRPRSTSSPRRSATSPTSRLRALHVLATGGRDRLRRHAPQRRAAAPLRHRQAAARACTSTTSAKRPAASSHGWRAASAWPTSATRARRRSATRAPSSSPRCATPAIASCRCPARAARSPRWASPATRRRWLRVRRLPAGARRRAHAALRAPRPAPSTQVLFEAPHRIEALAAALAAACAERRSRCAAS